MEFISNLPVFFWVVMVFAAIGGIYSLVTGKATKRDMEQAEALAQTGHWEESASIYRKLIIERFDFPDRAIAASDNLKALYRDQNIDADVSDLEQSMALLRDIESTKSSAGKKARMRNELLQKVVPILNALPPVDDSAPPTGVVEEFSPSSPPQSLDANCQFCGQSIAGEVWLFDDYARNPDLDANEIIGYVCPSCDAASHKDCESGIVFKSWSGYDKSVCNACGQPVKEPKVVFPT